MIDLNKYVLKFRNIRKICASKFLMKKNIKGLYILYIEEFVT